MQVNKVACCGPFIAKSSELIQQKKPPKSENVPRVKIIRRRPRNTALPIQEKAVQRLYPKMGKEVTDLKNAVGMTELKREEQFDTTNEQKIVEVIDLNGIDDDD